MAIGPRILRRCGCRCEVTDRKHKLRTSFLEQPRASHRPARTCAFDHLAGRGAGTQPCGSWVSAVPRRRPAPARTVARGRSGFRLCPRPQGLLPDAGLQCGDPARRPRCPGHGPAPVRERHLARARACQCARAMGRRRHRRHAAGVGGDPRSASPRRAGVPAASLPGLLARPPGPDGRAGRCGPPALEPGAGRLAGPAGVPLLCARGAWQLRRRRGFGARGHRAGARRLVGGARRRPRHGDAGTPRRRHRLAGWPGGQLGGRQQPRPPPLVAPRPLSFRAPGIRRGARPLRPPLPRS